MTREELIGMSMDEKIAYLIRDSLSIADATKEIMHLIDTYTKEYGEKQYNLGFSEGEDFGKHKERKKTRAKVLEARIDERGLALDDVNKLDGTEFDTDEHTNRVYNPYIEHHNSRVITLQAEKEKLDAIL